MRVRAEADNGRVGLGGLENVIAGKPPTISGSASLVVLDPVVVPWSSGINVGSSLAVSASVKCA